MTAMSKSTSRSRSSIFSTWNNKDRDKDNEKSGHYRDRSPVTPFSPSSTTSSPLPSTVPNSPLSDPFSCSIALPEPYRPSLSHVSPTFETHPSSSRYHSHSHSGLQQKTSTTKLVNGTEKTPKIVVASPSTGTIHYLFPDLSVPPRSASVSEASREKRGSRLDPSSAKTIARSIFKRQSKSVSDIKALARLSEGETDGSSSTTRPKVVESFYIPYSKLSPGSRPDPLRPARRVVSGTSTAGSTTSKEAKDGHEKHSLSMRTLRRQPSMADLTAGRRRGEALREAMKENGDRAGIMERDPKINKRQSAIWKTLDNRRESDTWRDLVNSMTRDQPPISTELVSPTDKTFPAIIHREIAKPTSESRDYNADTHRRSSSLSYTRPSGSIVDQSPSIPCPDFGDPIDFSVAMAESPSYSHFDYSTAGSSAISRSNTMSRTTRPVVNQPMSADMVRGETRRGLGSYETAKMIARDDAAKRLAGEGAYAILRRSMSFKRDTSKNRKSGTGTNRPRSQSMSAKSVRDMGISAPVPLPSANGHTDTDGTVADKAKKRQSLGPSRGIYLGDLSVDLGGRYTPSSPASSSSDSTSLYPASGGSAASYPRSTKLGNGNKPLHPALNGSEISILAPSTVGLGFSPIGTPASLPASLEAEAIDLTGTYSHCPEPVSRSTSTSARLPKRSTSLHRIKLEKPPSKAKPAEPAPREKSLRASDLEHEDQSVEPGLDAETESELKPRRSFLLAQNTFFIPPLAVPPSLRSSKSLSTLKLPIQQGSPESVDLLPPAPITTNPTPVGHDRRTRNGGFNLCSPSDAIDPLPHGDTVSPLSGPGVQRKKSTPFLTASASIRGIFRQNSTSIARTLSHAFDKDSKDPRSPTSRTGDTSVMTASPGEPDGEREWREGLLREAVTSSFSRTDVNTVHVGSSRPPKRMPIPAQLLEAAHVIEADEEVSLYGGMEVEVEADTGVDKQGEEPEIEAKSLFTSSQILSPSVAGSRVTSPMQKSRKKNRPPTPTSGRHLDSTQKNMISPPLPLFADLSRLGPSIATHSPSASPSTVTRLPEHVPQSVPMERVPAVGTVKLAPRRTSVSTSIGMSLRSLTLRPKKSKPKLNLPQPISSTTRLPPRPLLDELTALEQQANLGSVGPGAEDKARKVLEWRSEVLENGDLAALEEKMTKHVEREKEWMSAKKREVVAR